MASLLNPHRPPVFCPGCSHERSLHALDRALVQMELEANDVALVSDIGCSGLFDTFFNTHAFHGLHGRALTYAAGIKLVRPRLKVVAIMGDGGLGIGGAHILAACRRNLDLTLLVLNNFNFGMTGGQFSCTTPEDASVASGFLNALERPMDICTVAAAAGAPFVARRSVYQDGLAQLLMEAMSFEGFAVVDIRGVCSGRYLKRNALTPGEIEKRMGSLPPFYGRVAENDRREYGSAYRERIDDSGPSDIDLRGIEPVFDAPFADRREVVLLGSAGDRIISAGSILANAAILAGMKVTQKNDYNITVMRGPSVSELILSSEPILYTGVEQPNVIVALSPEGVMRRRELFSCLLPDGRVILEDGLEIPPTAAHTYPVDFKKHNIRRNERALAALSLLARTEDPITSEMLEGALKLVLKGKALQASIELLQRAAAIPTPY